MSNLKKRLNKTADNSKFDSLYQKALYAVENYVRACALDQLENDSNWSHDTADWGRDIAVAMEHDETEFKGLMNKLIQNEIDNVLNDFPYKNN